ncbi:MAG TPA: bifunctional 3,4-dihydroxy-2-butanone-4-phosphate synthase/GTP cyclohydrolase II [Actinomycetota bacterium]|jgi:3,4-dihydroxy 2-butanone 4-phosphate synthase/GTP cyclohydrolase II|nr:bifunctional 3,4-dihydroxy-2-butanone-4-phosphate synthase/GTP cyclohydrolase II [Actinomycetota bacterium]
MPFTTVDDAIARIRRGEVLIVVDDEDRENEGDLTMAAARVNPEAINFMIRHGRGLVCMPVEGKRLDELHLEPMVAQNTSSHETAFTVSIDHRTVTTGISAHERSVTIQKVLDPMARPSDFIRPGHVFPLRAKEGGVLRRAGHTEAAVDLSRMAGLPPAGVICEVLNEDGSTARLKHLESFAEDHGLAIVSIAQIIEHRRRAEKLVRRTAEAMIPTPYGTFRAIEYESLMDGRSHVAFVLGEPAAKTNVLVRVHSECFTGDIFGSLRCDCGSQLRMALQKIGEVGEGVVVYIRGHEGRGIGLTHKLKAYELQENGLDTVEANEALGFAADLRDYGTGAQILVDLGISTIRFLSNNPKKVAGIEGYGLRIVEWVPLQTMPTEENIEYLRTKRDKLGHRLDLPSGSEPEGT